MSSSDLVTRESLRRDLVVNAVTKPLAVSVGAAVAGCAFVLGVLWLLAVAAAVYVALALTTLFDEAEAARVGRSAYARARAGRRRRPVLAPLAPELAALVERARLEERRIARAIEESDLELPDVSDEVDALMAEMEGIARRAQLIRAYLDDQRLDEVERRLLEFQRGVETEGAAGGPRERVAAALAERLRVGSALQAELERFTAEMEHVIAALTVLHGEIVRLTATDAASLESGVARRVRELRGRVGVVADGLRETVDRLEDDDRRR